MRRDAILAAVSAAAFFGSIGATKADVIINTESAGLSNQDIINDAGGTAGTGNPNGQPSPTGNGLPLGLTGFNSQIAGTGVTLPSLIAETSGVYTFTYMGRGDSVNTDTFIFDGHTFNNHTNTAGDSFTVFLTAGTSIDFTYKDVTTGFPVTGDGSPTTELSYFLGLGTSTHCDNSNVQGAPPLAGCDLLGPPLSLTSEDFAYIGLADLPWAGTGVTLDHDYQDLGVRVDEEVPEPGSLALLGSAVLGLIGLRRRRKIA